VESFKEGWMNVIDKAHFRQVIVTHVKIKEQTNQHIWTINISKLIKLHLK
jgi:hypothetical protein